MNLPPELLDEIIDHISDEQSLRNCSLVAKSWVYPSRRQIFEFVDIWRDGPLYMWLDAISPTNIGVLQHVRSVQCRSYLHPDSPHPPAGFLHDYWPSFHHLERLAFSSGFLPPYTQIPIFSAFRHSLLSLSLRSCGVRIDGLVTLVDYFPNLAHLELVSLCHMAGGFPARFSRPLQKLAISYFFTKSAQDFLDHLMEQHPLCDEVSISTYPVSGPSLTQHVINGVEASVQRLNIESDLEGAFNIPKGPVVRNV